MLFFPPFYAHVVIQQIDWTSMMIMMIRRGKSQVLFYIWLLYLKIQWCRKSVGVLLKLEFHSIFAVQFTPTPCSSTATAQQKKWVVCSIKTLDPRLLLRVKSFTWGDPLLSPVISDRFQLKSTTEWPTEDSPSWLHYSYFKTTTGKYPNSNSNEEDPDAYYSIIDFSHCAYCVSHPSLRLFSSSFVFLHALFLGGSRICAGAHRILLRSVTGIVWLIWKELMKESVVEMLLCNTGHPMHYR